MKQPLITLIIMFALFLLTCDYPAAEPARSEISETLMKAVEKATVNSSYSMDIFAIRADGKEAMYHYRAYYKDEYNYRIDAEIDGKKTRTVVNGDKKWTYDEKTKMLSYDKAPPSFKEKLMKQDITAGKDGKNLTFSYKDADADLKVVIIVDPKENLFIKTKRFNGVGTLVSETIYENWNFNKINDFAFMKPEGAVEIKTDIMNYLK